MNLKKTFLIIIAAVLGCVAGNATQLTPAQKKAKTDIFNALKKIGTNLSDNGDESLSFNYDGTIFRASVHTLNPQTLYLTLFVGFELPEEYISEVANIAAFNAASGKPVCSFSSDGGLMFSCEMYAKDAKPFIAVLPEMLSALDSSADNFQLEYEKAVNEYVPSSYISEATGMRLNENEFIYPKITTNISDSRLYIKKVTLDSKYTILDMVSYNGGQYQNCAISKNSYLMANGKKYNMIKAEGISYSPTFTDYPGYESGREVSLNFKLYFPPLPKGTTSFDFMESPTDGWQIKGIELKHGNAYTINGNPLETPYHYWECIGIEVQDGQTILTKTVQPKSESTFMYSSQDEFIEDADTGRKYYLQNSSIGFESSPEISYGTNTVPFYEVYPALPTTVKKINISSGDQYYIRDMKIR